MGPSFELRDLRAFLAVAEEEHVGRAAERLNLSASPLSRQMLQLEARLGLTLFERVRKRLRLTASGRRFQEQAKALILHATELEQAIVASRMGDGDAITVGYVPGAMWSGFLPDLFRRFRVDAPDCLLRLHAIRSNEGIERLRRGLLDIAFVHTPPEKADPDCQGTLVHDDAFVLALPKEHRLFNEGAILKRAVLGEEDWISLDARLSPGFRNRFIAACGSYGFVPEFRHQVQDISSVMGLVEAGLGVAILQSAVMTRMAPPNVGFIALPGFPLTTQVHALWRPIGASSAVNRLVKLASEAKS